MLVRDFLLTMKEVRYLNRIADKTLDLRLEAFGVVRIAGPKWCSKTKTAKRRVVSVIKNQLSDRKLILESGLWKICAYRMQTW